MSTSNRSIRFVRALLKHNSACRAQTGNKFVIPDAISIFLAASEVDTLVSQGVLLKNNDIVKPSDEARSWVKRRLSTSETPFSQQHQRLHNEATNYVVNRAEGPLARLVYGRANFLTAHQLAAAARFQRLFERAALRTRITMSYDPGRVTQDSRNGNARADLPQMSYDARKQIERIYNELPADCAGVVIDVCGFEKGLQQIERERGWPRRSAKLVLRIGLEQLAAHFGLMPHASGQARAGLNIWRPDAARPTVLNIDDD